MESYSCMVDYQICPIRPIRRELLNCEKGRLGLISTRRRRRRQIWYKVDFFLSSWMDSIVTNVTVHTWQQCARFICTVRIRVGSGDPVRVLRPFHNKYTGYNWSIYCWDYVQLVATESNMLLCLLPTSVQLLIRLLCCPAREWTLELYCTVALIAACVDLSWNGIFWDRSNDKLDTWRHHRQWTLHPFLMMSSVNCNMQPMWWQIKIIKIVVVKCKRNLLCRQVCNLSSSSSANWPLERKHFPSNLNSARIIFSCLSSWKICPKTRKSRKPVDHRREIKYLFMSDATDLGAELRKQNHR